MASEFRTHIDHHSAPAATLRPIAAIAMIWTKKNAKRIAATGSVCFHARCTVVWQMRAARTVTASASMIGLPASVAINATSGRLIVRIVETGIETGNFFGSRPGHDAYVDGNERVELILFEPPEHQD